MQAVICDLCGTPLKGTELRGVFPIFKEGVIHPKTVEACEKCTLKISALIEGVEDLPENVVIPLNPVSKVEVVEE